MSTPTPSASSVGTPSDAQIRLAIDVSPDSESHFFVGLSGELSQGGIFVATYRDLTVGTVISIACHLHDEEHVLHGVVVWQRDAGVDSSPGIGVRFEEPSSPCRAAIERFCRLRAPLFYDVDLAA
jgi:uncharacterized protein (TIGR02266 family)